MLKLVVLFYGRQEMTEPAAPPKRRTGLLIWLIISQLLALGSLFLWVIVAGLSVMAFDEGGSPEAWAFVIAVWVYPLFPLLMAIGVWMAFAFRKDRLAAVLSGLSFVPPVLLFMIVWIVNMTGL